VKERHNPELAALLTKLAAALSTGDTAKMTKLLKLLQQADGSPAAGADKLGLSATPMDNGRTIGKQKTDAAVRTGSLTDTSLSTDMKTGSPAADRSHPASGLRSAEEASPINEGAVNKKEAQRSDRAPRSTGPDSSVGRVVLTDFPDGRMSKVALLLAYGGPDASESASSGDLSRQVSDRLAAWMNKSSFSFPPAGEQRLTMTLYPEQLGQLTVTVSQTADGIVAKLIASTAEARDLLESGLNQLKQDFVSRGLPVSQIDVSRQWQVPYNDPGSEAAPNHNGSSQDGQDRPDGHNDDQKQQRASSIDTVREDEDGRSFSEWLTGGMSEWLKLQV
jgi:flagellar hook-length control protein FliK